MTIPAVRNPDRCPVHLGAVIADILEDFPVSKSQLARHLGISRQHLHDILAERKPMSRSTAAKLGAAFGNGPLLWLDLQAAYDGWQAERYEDVSHIPHLHA